jgi:hypothetical protein
VVSLCLIPKQFSEIILTRAINLSLNKLFISDNSYYIWIYWINMFYLASTALLLTVHSGKTMVNITSSENLTTTVT